MMLTNINNNIKHNYLVHPDRGLITPSQCRMVGEALAYVQGASLKAKAAFTVKSNHSPITHAGNAWQSVI